MLADSEYIDNHCQFYGVIIFQNDISKSLTNKRMIEKFPNLVVITKPPAQESQTPSTKHNMNYLNLEISRKVSRGRGWEIRGLQRRMTTDFFSETM